MSAPANTMVQGLRDIADWIEKHPDLGDTHMTVDAVFYPPDEPASAGRWARAFGKAEKSVTDNGLFKLTHPFGEVEARAVFWREAVCEKKVVGVREVTRMVPDPSVEVEMVEVVETVEDVEWVCPPILTGGRS